MALLPVLLDMVDEIYESLDTPSQNFTDIPLLFVPQRNINNTGEKTCPRRSGRRGCHKSARSGCTREGAKEEISECQKSIPSEMQGECPRKKCEKSAECPNEFQQQFAQFGQFFSPEAMKKCHEMFTKYREMAHKECPSTSSFEGKPKCNPEECKKNECPAFAQGHPFAFGSGRRPPHCGWPSKTNDCKSDECEKNKCPEFNPFAYGRRPPHHMAMSFNGKCPREMMKARHCACPCKPNSDDFKVTLDVKSFKPEEISVKVKGHEIIVDGKHEEREDENGFVSRQFTRRYILPDQYDPDTITTYLKADGKLTIRAIKPKPVGDDNSERVIPIERVDVSEEEDVETSKRDDEDSEKVNDNAIAAATTSTTDENGSQKDFVVVDESPKE